MKYANYDEKTRQILGWYDNEIHKEIPIPNIDVSDEGWQNAIDNNHNKVNSDGTTEVFDFRTSEEIEQAELEQKIAEAKAYLSNTDFKMTVDYYASLTLEAQEGFTAKRAEARAFLKENGL